MNIAHSFQKFDEILFTNLVHIGIHEIVPFDHLPRRVAQHDVTQMRKLGGARCQARDNRCNKRAAPNFKKRKWYSSIQSKINNRVKFLSHFLFTLLLPTINRTIFQFDAIPTVSLKIAQRSWIRGVSNPPLSNSVYFCQICFFFRKMVFIYF